MTRRFLWPREHGAWAMLLLPFLCGVAVAATARWESLAALAVILTVFLAQEPALTLLRQRIVWREAREASRQATWSLCLLLPPAAVAAILLFVRLPWKPLAALSGVAAVLMAWRAVFTLSNKQRFVLLQVLEAAGLTSTALLGYLSARGSLDRVAWLLWGAFSVHHAAALLVIRARLEAIIGSRARTPAERRCRVAAWFGQVVLAAVAVWAFLGGNARLGLAFAIPFALHSRDLLLLDSPPFLKIPLTRAGWREVLISVAFAAVLVSAL